MTDIDSNTGAQVSRRRFIGRTLAVGGGVLALPSLLAACGGDDKTTPTTARPGTPTTGSPGTAAGTTVGGATASSVAAPATTAPATIAAEIVGAQLGDFVSFDPYYTRAFDRLQHFQIFDPLVLVSPEDGGYAPHLASSWEYAADGLSVTLHLRDDVKFHSGAPMNADAVVANLERARDPEVGHPLATAAQPISAVSAVDGQTVLITYSVPVPEGAAIDLLASLFIIDPAAMADVETNPVGTGPYTFGGFRPGEQLTLEANPDYWREDLPKTQRIVIRTFTDASAMALNLEGDDINLAVGLDYNQVEPMAASGLNVLRETSLGAYWTAIVNTRREQLADKRVRQAISHAIDREKIVRNVFSNQTTATCTPFYSEATPVYRESDLTKYAFDLDKASSLLADAGVTGLTFEAIFLTSLPQAGGILEILQADLSSIGVTLNIQSYPAADGQERFTNGDYDVFLSALAVPARDLSSIFSQSPLRPNESNTAGFVDSNYQAKVVAASTEVDAGKRLAIYEELRDILLDESFIVPIAARPVLYGLNPSIQGFYTRVGDYPVMSEMSMSK